MDSIFHEKQEGSLCAQHCLNSLLQGSYFSAVDLASIAQDLDDVEGAHMAEGGVDSVEYLRFQEQPSTNMDDSGFFSVQVISKALFVWELVSIPIGSSEAGIASVYPERECAFICNFREHWLTIRKLGNQWFNLNSLLTGPELISDTYLSMFLAQLQKEGYSIFVIRGSLPECEADQLLRLIPAVQTHPPKLLSDDAQSSNQKASTGVGVTQDDLQKALEASRGFTSGYKGDDELQAAIQLSLRGTENQVSEASEPVNQDELRRKREAFFNRQNPGPTQSSAASNQSTPSEVPSTSKEEEKRELSTAKERVESNTNNSAKTSSPSCTVVAEQETGELLDSGMTESAMLEAAIKMSIESVEQKT
ncbi:ataxin-3 isoform X1 [Strongylocentrotus purpuratus]|uniref:ubiquitinyl hydrolase 1 n=1 Tax=Strongylocentrotus purpuratus TaxID=7668 RepID=A0A7M7REK6_STRPU|nr:ataxin-3 isoform X1 [Strongylocentrotus purpuratus]|eukprot:XP_786733.3 PREDICTED: ataxin-3 [Strongylocentrotus purpuratus]